MSFTRETRFTASHRDFEYDKDGHTKNLRALETYLEAPYDWLRLLIKTGLPAIGDINKGSDAVVNFNGVLYHVVDGVWVKIQDDVNSYTNAQIDDAFDAVTAAIVDDHGELNGLADDDHPQYHNDARGDARYSQLGHTHDDRYYTEAEVDALLAGVGASFLSVAKWGTD